jgi:hypothetical protein
MTIRVSLVSRILRPAALKLEASLRSLEKALDAFSVKVYVRVRHPLRKGRKR